MKRSDVKVGGRYLKVEDVDRRGRPVVRKWIIVTKIGRRWAEFYPEGDERYKHLHGRFDLDNFRLDGHGYQSLGAVWIDEWDYEMHVEKREVWRQFHNAVRQHYGEPPANVDAGDIRQIAKRLGFDL